jgi:predicted aminopeptidase
VRKFRIVGTDLILLLLLLYTLTHVQLTVYGLGQGRGQMLILWKAESIEKMSAGGSFSASESEKLNLIRAVKDYSVDSLEYKPSKNYTTYYEQRGRSLLWIVTACKPFAFEDYEWKFPYLGKVSYKGYFDSLKAAKEARRLKLEGFDSDISRVNAWSTLGWFRDPVFSEMLKKHKGELANLIFHELFHGTIYAQNSVELNENLANFIAHKATMQFLAKDSSELSLYMKDHAAELHYDKHIFKCIERLDSLYSAFKAQPQLSEREKKLRKFKLLSRFGLEMKQQKFLSHAKADKLTKRFLNSGNAYFMHFSRYDGLADSLENVLQKQHGGDLRKMIIALKGQIKSL